MLFKFFIDYPYVVYSIIVWGYIFVVIRIKGIKRLWPVSILSAIVLFSLTYWLVSADLYKFNINFLPILGIPFFYILWGAGSGIIFAYYYGETFFMKAFPVLGFSAIVVLFESFVEKVKRVEHLGKFTDVHEYVFDVLSLLLLVFLMENLFGSRLKKIKNQ